MTTPVSRRTIAKGAAWAVPATIVASAAPAMASSVPGVGHPVICDLFFGTGTVNGQRTVMHFGLKKTGTTLKRGQKYTWNVSSSTGAMDVPNLNYSKDGRWILTTNKSEGSQANGSFTVTLEILAEDVTDTEIGCVPALLWDNGNSTGSATIVPGTTLTMQASGPEGSESSGLSVRIPRRWSNTKRENIATKFISKSGGQDKFPAVRYSGFNPSKANYGSNGSVCGETWANNTSTIYPDGTCAKLNIRENAQESLPPRA